MSLSKNMNKPTFSVIITTKDRLESLKRLIDSVEHFTENYELIIFNDASIDGTNEWLANQHLRYRHSRGPRGYQSISYTTSIPVATAWNVGCEVANGDFIQILNDDMEVTEGWLKQQKQLYEYLIASGRRVGVLAAKLLRGDEVLSRGGAFREIHLVPVPPPEEVKPVDYSNTPFLKRTLWKEVGGFVAHAQLYYEDADMGLRVQSEGYTNFYKPESGIRHETLGFRPEHGEEQYNRRLHNESVIQAQAKESFMKKWEHYLLTEHKNIY